MSTTIKRIQVCLTIESKRQLEILCARFGENSAQVLNRALQMLYYSLESEDRNKNNGV